MNDTIIPNDNTNANRNSTVQCDIFVNIWNQLYTQGFQEISSMFPGYVLDWKYGSRSRWVVTSQCGSLPSGLPYFQFQNFDILQISSGFFGSFLDIGYEEDIPKSCLHQRWAHLFQALELWDLIGLIRFFGLISGFQIRERHSEVSSSSEMGLPLRSSRILEFSQIPSSFWYFLWNYNLAEMVQGEFLNFGINYWNYGIF